MEAPMNRVAIPILVLALAAAAVGCGSVSRRPPSIAATSYPGVPSGAPDESVRRGATLAVWTDGQLALTTWGSGSCPAVPVALTALDASTVEITVSADYGASPCTADLSPTTSVIDLPDTLTGPGPLTVKVLADGAAPIILQVPRS
jgi:hypothetical protein